MDFTIRSLFSLLIFIFLGGREGFFISICRAEVPKVCVAALSLLENKKQDDALHREIQSSANTLLKEAGYAHPSSRYIYKRGTPKIIRECLEGPYEDVIIIAQESHIVEEHGSLLYRTTFTNPQGTKEEKWAVLDRWIFRNVKIQKTLRQITLIACNAEDVLEEYQILKKLAEAHRIHIKLQPMSILGSIGKLDIGIRAQNLIGAMIAESSQDEMFPAFYCLLRTNVGILYEYGDTSCLRNHYHLSFHGPLSVGLKTSTKWLKLTVDQKDFTTVCDSQGNCAVLDLELAFIRGINVNISRNPIDFTKESFGVSFSPFQYLSVTKIP